MCLLHVLACLCDHPLTLPVLVCQVMLENMSSHALALQKAADARAEEADARKEEAKAAHVAAQAALIQAEAAKAAQEVAAKQAEAHNSLLQQVLALLQTQSKSAP